MTKFNKLRPQRLTREGAEALALQALAFIAGDEDRLGRFLAASGFGPAELRARVSDPTTLGFVLDFLLGDEEAVIAFAAEQQIDPALPARARALLPGGDAL